MEYVENQLDDDRLAAAGRRDGRVDDWNQLLIQVIHAVVWETSTTRADLITHLHQPASQPNNQSINNNKNKNRTTLLQPCNQNTTKKLLVQLFYKNNTILPTESTIT